MGNDVRIPSPCLRCKALDFTSSRAGAPHSEANDVGQSMIYYADLSFHFNWHKISSKYFSYSESVSPYSCDYGTFGFKNKSQYSRQFTSSVSRLVGKECNSKCSYRWSPSNHKKKETK